MKKKSVKIYTTPNTTADKCGEEWIEFGTCCEEKSLETYVIKDSGHSKLYISELSTELEIYSENLEIMAVSLNDKIKKIEAGKARFKLSSKKPRRNKVR